MSIDVRTLDLRTGDAVAVRPMQPTDAARLVRFHGTLSPETTRWRYFVVHPDLRPEEIDRFTHVDHDGREALVATVDDEIVGVARWDRLPDGHRAEVAFVVADGWQGRGLGTALLALLVECARAHGIDAFVAETLGDNRRMQAVLHHAGLPAASTFADGVIEVTLDLRSPSGPTRMTV